MKRRTEYVKCASGISAFINAWEAEVHSVYNPADAPIVAANFLWLRQRWHEFDFRAAYVYSFVENMYVHLGTGELYARQCEECALAPPVGILKFHNMRVDYDRYWQLRESVSDSEYIVLIGPWPPKTPQIPHLARPGASAHRGCAEADRGGVNEWWGACMERDWECHIISIRDLYKYAPLIAVGRAMKHKSWIAIKALQNAVAEALIHVYEHELPRSAPAAIIVDSIVVPEHIWPKFRDVLIPVKYIPNEWGERYSLAGLIHRKERDKWRAWILGQDVVHYKSIDYYYRNILDGLLRSGRPEDYPHDTILPIMHHFRQVQYRGLIPLGKLFKDVDWWQLI